MIAMHADLRIYRLYIYIFWDADLRLYRLYIYIFWDTDTLYIHGFLKWHLQPILNWKYVAVMESYNSSIDI